MPRPFALLRMRRERPRRGAAECSQQFPPSVVGFRPPPVRAESLATALRQSEEGGAFGGLSFNWDIALNLGDYAGFWDAPEDEQGREVVRQYSVLKKHRREQVYNIAGNHDASPHGHPANEGKETNWWFRKWCDPVGEHTETSGVDPNKRPYPIDGSWERLHLQGRQYPLPDDGRPQ